MKSVAIFFLYKFLCQGLQVKANSNLMLIQSGLIPSQSGLGTKLACPANAKQEASQEHIPNIYTQGEAVIHSRTMLIEN